MNHLSLYWANLSISVFMFRFMQIMILTISPNLERLNNQRAWLLTWVHILYVYSMYTKSQNYRCTRWITIFQRYIQFAIFCTDAPTSNADGFRIFWPEDAPMALGASVHLKQLLEFDIILFMHNNVVFWIGKEGLGSWMTGSLLRSVWNHSCQHLFLE